MSRAVRAVLVLLVFVCGAVAPGAAARAQLPDSFEQIDSYDVTLALQANGDLQVTETIAYNFGTTPKRGIYREIPVRFRYDERNDRVYPLRDIRVRASAGANDDVHLSDEAGGLKRIRIGDEDTYISGRHTYTITYVAEGSVNRFSDHDELFWNAIGTEWNVPMTRSSVRVTAPSRISRAACFAGPQGSVLPCARMSFDGTTATFTNGPLGAGEAFTVVIAVAPNSIANAGPILKERWTLNRAFERTPKTVAASLALLGAGLLGVCRLLWITGRDRRWVGETPGLDPVGGVTGVESRRPLFSEPDGPVEFAPPEDMTPALMGVLIDERADALDVTASIVDLAVRRHLLIEELPREGLFRRRNWRLTRLPGPPGDLLAWEAKLLNALFRSGSPVELRDLKNSFHTDLAALKQSLYADVVARGWYRRSPEATRTLWQGIGIAGVVAGGGLTYVLAANTRLGLLGLPLVVLGLAVLAVARHMPSRTAKGSAALARALGFRRYLATAETNQLRFEEQEGIFARYLPYAVVLGEVDRWAKAFGDLGERAQRELYWYSGPSGWTPGDFSDSISSFSSSSGSTLASTPGSSGGSGFSGGGSSGGGGGGGGGGSW